MPFETALDQWKRGIQLLDSAPADQRDQLERATSEIEAHLRRRLGGAFSAAELVALYDEGTGWCADVAVMVTPEASYAWDVRIVADAAFARYLREAVDYAGGRLLG